MKKATFLTLSALALLTACQNQAPQQTMQTTFSIPVEQGAMPAEDAQSQPETAAPTARTIACAVTKADDVTKVSIDQMPRTLSEFNQAYAEVGKEPEGAVMAVLMAMDIYRQDPELGKECIKLCNVDNNFYSITSRLKDLYSKDDPYYGRQYQVAAFFEGATPQNGFNPTRPYTIRVRKHPVHPDERSQSLRGYVKYLQVYSDGFDSSWRGCDVVRQQGDELYKVANCPSMYTQCKEIDFDATDTFHGL